MSTPRPENWSNCSLMDLFRVEAESQTVLLTASLLDLEQKSDAANPLEQLMRAAHSLKGAARIVDLEAAVRVAHAMEDCFVAAQQGRLSFQPEDIDLLLGAVDLLARIARTPDSETKKWQEAEAATVDRLVNSLKRLLTGQPEPERPVPATIQLELPTRGQAVPAPALESTPGQFAQATASPETPASWQEDAPSPPAPAPPRSGDVGENQEVSERVLRVTADHLNRLLGLAGESLVESRWLSPFADSLLRLHRLQFELSHALDNVRASSTAEPLADVTRNHLQQALVKGAECRRVLTERLAELEMFDRRSANLANRLYHEALACRTRPFSDGLHGFPRMVRDLGRSLGKEVNLRIIGANTHVDRDVLEKLEAPLTQLLRNALDHGLESPDERARAGKPLTGTICLEARHAAGKLLVTVSDDGRGIACETLRQAVVRKNLTSADTAARLSEAELMEFLFLPGFSLKERVTEISGRGVGLDVVQSMVKQVRGITRVISQPGKGTRFQLQLPLTLSVMRALLVEIAEEPYAFPLAHITRTLKLSRHRVQSLEGRQHFESDGRHVGLVTARQLLERGEFQFQVPGEELALVLLSDSDAAYGVVVDRFLGERELVVQPLDARLGKIKNISAGALMEDGSPVLIVDTEDLIRSIEKLAGQCRPHPVQPGPAANQDRKRKRVLVVDDSLTVRELERKLLAARGYEVELAVDGMDGWNAARSGQFQLIITDVDMPRMDGIELVTQLKRDPRLRSIPAMIVSYKDHETDRQRGLEAGADYYLSKGGFHDDTLLRAVVDLIGEADA